MAVDPEELDTVRNELQFHTPLDRASRQIRLLALAPSVNDDAAISCTMEIVSLTATPRPRYEALSYCWGDMKDTRAITLRHRGSNQHLNEPSVDIEQQFEVTANLHIALRRLRLKDQERRLWVDALCINQNNPIERGHQVSFMRSIYKSAEETLIWLGEDDGTVENALRLVVKIVKKMTRLDQLTASDVSEDDISATAQEISDDLRNLSRPGRLVSPSENLPSYDDDAWKALASLVSRPWFTRVWVIQEVGVSPQATVHIGEHSMDWAAIGLAAAWLSRNNVLAQTGVQGFRYADNATLMFRFASPEANVRLGVEPLALLWLMRDYEATDPRDKVFASLGLMYNEDVGRQMPALMATDYTKTTEEVYRDVAKYCIRRNRSLDALSMVQPHRASVKLPEEDYLGFGATPHHPLENIPVPKPFASWIPRWEFGFGGGNSGPLGLFPEPIAGKRPLYQASGSLSIQPLSLKDQPDARSLPVRGLRLDRITSVSGHIWANYLDLDLPVHPRLRDFVRSDNNALKQIWHAYRSNFMAYPTSENAMTVLRLLMVANRTRMKARADEDTTHEADFAAYLHAIGYDAQSLPDNYRKRHKDLLANAEGDARRYSRDLVHSCSARSVFATTMGYLGLCHVNVQVGDVVVMLYGGKVLYVLRPYESFPQVKHTWMFLGEAYMHGAMDGQAMAMRRAFEEASEIFDLR